MIDNQIYMTEGRHIIEDCLFDGQKQVYDMGNPINFWGTCINTVFRRNVVRDFTLRETNQLGVVLLMSKPVAGVVGQPQVTIADNTFYGNQGVVVECVGDTDNQRCYRLVSASGRRLTSKWRIFPSRREAFRCGISPKRFIGYRRCKPDLTPSPPCPDLRTPPDSRLP